MRLKPVLLAALLTTVAATAQDVRYNYAFGQNFSQLRTYAWTDNAGDVDELTAQQIRSSIDSVLAKKGFSLRDKERADLILNYQVSTNKEKQLTLYNDNWGFGRGWRFSPGVTTGQTSTIRTGELALDIYGAEPRQLLWRGIISDTIPAKQKPEEWRKQLDGGAVKLLKSFPPPTK